MSSFTLRQGGLDDDFQRVLCSRLQARGPVTLGKATLAQQLSFQEAFRHHAVLRRGILNVRYDDLPFSLLRRRGMSAGILRGAMGRGESPRGGCEEG